MFHVSFALVVPLICDQVHFINFDKALSHIMDQAEVLLNLQSRRSTRQSKPTKHPDFLYTDADLLHEGDLTLQHQSPFADPSLQQASGGHHFSSVAQPSKQSNKQPKLSKKSQKSDSGLPLEAAPTVRSPIARRANPPSYKGLPSSARIEPHSSSRPDATERDLS